MTLRKTLIAILGLVTLPGLVNAAEVYHLDPVHSTIEFSVPHMMISRVKGKFPKFEGSLSYDGQEPTRSQVQVTIEAASIDTGNPKRDDDLRSADFLDVANYPTITFKSTRIERLDKEGSTYQVTGDLVIHGTKKTVSFPVTVNGPIKDPWGNQRLGIHGNLTINRMEFGVKWSQKLDTGGLVVGEEVHIELNIEAVKEAPQAK